MVIAEIENDLASEVPSIDPRIGEEQVEMEHVEEFEEVLLSSEDATRTVRIGNNFTDETKEQLKKFLQESEDVFAWSHSDMVGIDPNIISHVLNIDPKYPPKQQK